MTWVCHIQHHPLRNSTWRITQIKFSHCYTATCGVIRKSKLWKIKGKSFFKDSRSLFFVQLVMSFQDTILALIPAQLHMAPLDLTAYFRTLVCQGWAALWKKIHILKAQFNPSMRIAHQYPWHQAFLLHRLFKVQSKNSKLLITQLHKKAKK